VKYANLTAAQLAKLIKRRPMQDHAAAHVWAERIESDKQRCALPKKEQRKLGLLPPVNGNSKNHPAALVPMPVADLAASGND